MKKVIRMMVLMAALPLVAMAQGYDGLDAAISNLSRGFGNGESRAIVAGLGESDQVRLQFPGLIEESDGFFGRDQASYLLEKLFAATKPGGFERLNERKFSREGQYRIEANWTIDRGGRSEVVPLYLTLQSKGDRWFLASAQSVSKK
ncbi:MAG TPA: hypothetical protein VM557_04435 [Thermoanaerobaculia bacterium]|nr:hypothetical protein [Thermoanaerobaculia bacterium]